MSGKQTRFVVIVSAIAEWEPAKAIFPDVRTEYSPYGEYFFAPVQRDEVAFVNGGWGKVAAAASTQYVIDHFEPKYLINLGTCGGIEGRVRRFDVVAPERVVIQRHAWLRQTFAHFITAGCIRERLDAAN